MRTENQAFFSRTLLCVAILCFFCPRAESQTASAPVRITQAVDEKNLVVLKGNVHPLARPEFDQGPASDAQPLHRMLLLLRRSPDQEAVLQKLLDDQQSKSSPRYHAWLTPAQFGQQFGPADADIQTVTNWLQSQGFQITNVAAGRTVIEFSGNAAQVRSAFHTEIHKYLVNGEARMANASDPQIPAALVPAVAGPVSLNNFPLKSHLIPLGSFFRSKTTGETRPLTTTGICGPSSCFALGPADFATIYNSAPLLTGTPKIDGTGQTIAIVGESNINVVDVTDFRTMFGLPQNFSTSNIILNGQDPGVDGSEGESDLDVQWAGAVAPGATIDFVTSAPTETTAGILLSAIYIVDNNLAGVMSESFGACEQQIGTLNQFHNSLWEQAAAQGITVMVSSGDGGSAGCDNFDTAQTATHGLGVSGFASTPFDVAVGGTDFDQLNRWTQFWSLTNDPTTQGSALGYIPEIPWNDSCAQLGISGCGASAPQGSLNIVAGSGGASILYAKPSWQSGTGVPADNHRDVPDVSLFASNGFDNSFYIMCQRDVTAMLPCTINIFQGVGGTSVSSPAFAGIMALVNQSLATANNPAPRQGNANYVLYQLFKKQVNSNPAINCNSSVTPSTSCTFYDVTQGNSALANGSVGTNSVPCAGGSTNCSSKLAGTNGILVTPANPSTPAYSTTAGYDLATGLGSVNVANLVKNWSTLSSFPSTTTLSATVNGQSASSITGITHGTIVNLTSSVAAGQGASGTPSGQVALLATPNPNAGLPGPSLGFDVLNLSSSGTATGNLVLPGGTYSLTAHYQGDGTFGSSDSPPPGLSVNISAEPSKTLISLPTFDPNTGFETGNAPTTLVYGSPYIGRVDVGNVASFSSYPQQPVCNPPNCPTGTITLTDALNGGAPTPLDAGTFLLNSSGFTEDLPIQLLGGTHLLFASYSGDNSFKVSSGSYAVTVTPAATRILPPNPPLPPMVSTPFSLSVILTPNAFGVAPSCNLTFFDGTTVVPGTVTCGWQANGPFLYVSLPVSQATPGTHTYMAKFNGDTNYAPSTSAPMTTRVFYGTTTTLSADSTNVQYGTSITLTALVDSSISQGPPISQSVSFMFDNNPVTGTVTYSPFTDSSGNLALRASLTTVPQSSGFYTANFAGDSSYFQSAALLNVSVNIPDFTLSANFPAPSITAGSSGTATITVTPASSAASPVALACPPVSLYGTPVGISCSFSPNTVNLSNSAAATSTLMISTAAPSSSNSTSFSPPQPPPVYLPPDMWLLPLVPIFALLLFLLLPAPSRRKRLASAAALACGLCFFLGFFGCGGGSASIGGGGGGGPVPASVTLTASSVKVPFSSTSGGDVNLTANVTASKTPGGAVTFIVDGNSGYIASVPVVGGVAQFQLTGLSVGVHTIAAQYSGDANTLSSQTKGSLNVAVTGQTGVSVQGTTGGLIHTVTVNFNLQ
ncbi:MAG: Ig-like domain repeat protein [Candidatus Acidiferrum sp.]